MAKRPAISFFIASMIAYTAFLSSALASGTYDGYAGLRCVGGTSTTTISGTYINSLNCPSSGVYYSLTYTTTGKSFYVDIYRGTVGSSTIINGHATAYGPSPFYNSYQNDDFTNLTQGQDYFIAIYNYTGALRTWFQTGATTSPPSTQYGILTFKGGTNPALVDTSISSVIEILSPTTGSTTASTAVNFQFSYYKYGTQVNSYQIFLVDKLSGLATSFTGSLPSATTSIVSTTRTLTASSTYTAYVSLYPATIPDLQYGQKTVEFNVVHDTFAKLGVPNVHDFTGVATSTCDVLNISGCMQNALLFVFYPSETILNNFAELGSLIATKPPFGYIAVYTTQLAGLSSSGAGSFTLATENNIKTIIFDPLRTGLGYVLWVCFAFWIFHRVRKQEL